MNNVIRFGDGFIELEFKPDWSKVQNMWTFLKSAIQLTLYDSTQSDIISMAGIELTENAVKYSLSHNPEESIILFKLQTEKLKNRENRVVITVENIANEEHIKQIAESVEKMMKEKDKRKAYLLKLSQSMSADAEEENMELGVLRVISEAKAKVSIDSTRGRTLSIKAAFKVKRKMH